MSYRHIEIGGVSYVGSTTLNLILGSLPEVQAIGESHWLTDIHQRLMSENGIKPEAVGIIDQEGYEKGFQQCQLCGHSCVHYTREMRKTLKKGIKENWHTKLAQAFDARVIVTSDKHPAIISSLDRKLLNATIVMFKHPFNSWVSYSKRNETRLSWMRQYAEVYNYFLNNYKNQGPLLFLSWENFLQRPEETLEKICSTLRLEFDSSALEYWKKDHHYIGGNYNLYERDHDTLPLRLMDGDSEQHKKFLDDLQLGVIKVIYQQMLSRSL